MNEDTLKGQWKQIRGKIREKWGDISDDELEQIAGRKDMLAGKLQEKYGYSREEAERELDTWMRDSGIDFDADVNMRTR